MKQRDPSSHVKGEGALRTRPHKEKTKHNKSDRGKKKAALKKGKEDE